MRHSAFKWCAFLILVSHLSPAASYAQEDRGMFDPVEIDTNYIEDYTNWLTTRLYLLYQDASFIVSSEKADNIIFRPNTNVKIGIAGFYRWFGLGLSMNNPFYHFNEEDYGKTQAIDLRINFFGRSVAAEAFFQNFKGFYITNIYPDTKARYTIPNMNLFSMGAYGYWILNSSRFSIRAAFLQNERQVKSAGSFMVRPGFSYYQVTSDSGLIPPELVEKYQIPANELILGGNFYSISLAPGYSYTFVFLKNGYVNLAAFPGVSYSSYVYNTEMNEFSGHDFIFNLGLRVAAGYNNTKWFIGAAWITGFNDLDAYWSKSSFFYDVSQIRLWGGVRFDVFSRKKKKNH